MEPPIIMFTLLGIGCLCPAYDAASSVLLWSQGYDSLTEYELIGSYGVETIISCTSLASREIDVQVATFNASTGVCNAFRCRLGLSHCRKCRNVHQGNQLVWRANESCWTTVQHRVSGSVDFFRNWSDYKAGFGEGPDGNFWIGLEILNMLTTAPNRQLRFLMKLWNGTMSWAQYSSFIVGPESDNYRMNVSGFIGSAGINDSLARANGYQFSTKDRDNDVLFVDGVPQSCAAIFHGAWWFCNCFSVHFNGVYQEYPTALNVKPPNHGILWAAPYGMSYSLNEVEILIM